MIKYRLFIIIDVSPGRCYSPLRYSL